MKVGFRMDDLNEKNRISLKYLWLKLTSISQLCAGVSYLTGSESTLSDASQSSLVRSESFHKQSDDSGTQNAENFSSLLRSEFKQVDAAGSGLRPASVCALCRNAERGFGTHAGNSSSSSSLRHHNKLIPTSLTSHWRQSYELGARQGRTLAQGAGCWATIRLGLTVTRVVMAGLLGDGDGDVSLRDVSPRDISLYRAFARGVLRLWPMRATSSETEWGSSSGQAG